MDDSSLHSTGTSVLDSTTVRGTDVDVDDYYTTTMVTLNSTSFNNSKSGNDTEEIDPFFFYQTEQLTVLWILFFIIIFGNMGVLANLLCGHRRKSRMNFFIKQLAFADLLVGLISVLTDIIWRYSVDWYAGNFACKIIKFLQIVVTYSSNYVLVSLSIDRYDAITRPMSFSRSWYRARILVVIAWSISIFYSLPILYLYEEKMIGNRLQCWLELGSQTHWRIYMTIVSITLFVIPTGIISGCYIVIIHTIWSQSGILKHDAAQDTRRVSSRGIIPQAKIKTVKMTLVIVFVFILCWSPYIVFDLLQVYGQIPESQTYTAIATFIQSLAPLNSAANPLIYCLFSTSFCKTVRSTQPMSWFTSLFVRNPQRSFATTTQSSDTERATVTTSLMTNSGRCSGQISTIHHPRRRVMVSNV